jgi:hypothetical protein
VAEAIPNKRGLPVARVLTSCVFLLGKEHTMSTEFNNPKRWQPTPQVPSPEGSYRGGIYNPQILIQFGTIVADDLSGFGTKREVLIEELIEFITDATNLQSKIRRLSVLEHQQLISSFSIPSPN